MALSPSDREAIVLYKSDTPFGQMTKEEKTLLYQDLMQGCKFVGVKEPPAKEDMVDIVNFLCARHKNFTRAELKQALHLMVSGELGTEIEHFQSPTAQYWSRIIRMYENTRARALKKYQLENQQSIDAQESQQRSKEYDPEGAVIDCLVREYDAFLMVEETNVASPVAEFRASTCMHLCRKLGIFEDIEENKFTPLQYLRRYFLLLHGERDKVCKKIEFDVRNRRKGLGS
jgi:hypothetical protein